MDKHLERMERMQIQRIRLAKGEDVDEIPDEE